LTERIDHTNYEAWLLDRLEGNLTPEQERELQAFLVVNPELAPVDEELPTVAAFADALAPLDIAALKKTIPPVGLVNDARVDDHLIARLEGDLDPQQLEALRQYLVLHPEWQNAEKTYALTKLVPEAMAFAAKRELERHFPPQGMPNAFNLDDFLVARMEGDLNAEQNKALDRFLDLEKAHQRAAVLMQATRVKADHIIFAGKEGLKKREGRLIAITSRTWAVRLAAAASVAILLGLGLWFLRAPNDVHQNEFARVPTTPTAPEVKVPMKEDVGSNTQHSESPTTNNNDAPTPVPALRQEARPALAPKPVPVPVVPIEEPALAQDRVVPVRTPREETPAPVVPEANDAPEPLLAQEKPVEPANADEAKGVSVGELLAGTLRDRVLNEPQRTAQPLDKDDAVAMVDKSLKVVGGDRAGLAVARKADGGVSGFNLRLGRNISISASR